jgi:hypothetical protein
MKLTSHQFKIRASAAIATALVAVGVSSCGSSADGSASASRSRATDGTNLAPIHGPYAPSIDPANFVRRVDNPYLPFKPGAKLRLAGVAENGVTPQTDIESVTHKTKLIMGVECTVVRDAVRSKGKPVELTFDWYAQDRKGNVWYFGEDARDFEHGHYVKASDSWQAGVDGAQPGIIMEAHPKPGDRYRQEFYPGHALDQAKVIGTAPVTVPSGSFRKALVTVERSALEPGVLEKKFNVRGIGVVAERVVKGNHERFELVGLSR